MEGNRKRGSGEGGMKGNRNGGSGEGGMEGNRKGGEWRRRDGMEQERGKKSTEWD